MSALNSPFQGDMKPAPSLKADSSGNNFECAGLNKPYDGQVLGQELYCDDEGLKGSPAALASPMGTAIPNVGKGFKPQP